MAKVESAISYLPVPADDEHSPELHAAYERMLERSGFIPNVFRIFAFREPHLLRWWGHYDELLRGESGLSKQQREMIAVVVSATNRCHYCLVSHSAALRVLTKDPVFAEHIVTDYRVAPLEPKERAMLDHAVKVTADLEACDESDIDTLRAAGWSDEEIWDITEVAAMFNFTNRLASALGWRPNEEFFTMGREPGS
jgi:uncharacterized peroxidase-related enzyme